MPVILNAGSAGMRTWLDPKRREWTRELQSLLKPFEGALDCYAVSGAVGKVGNNSPDFVVPVASAANRNNIANFFIADTGKMVDIPRSEDNAPMPAEAIGDHDLAPRGIKREREGSLSEENLQNEADTPLLTKVIKSNFSHANKLPSKPSKGMRSSTTNGRKVSPQKAATGNQRITDFFSK